MPSVSGDHSRPGEFNGIRGGVSCLGERRASEELVGRDREKWLQRMERAFPMVQSRVGVAAAKRRQL